MTEFSFIATGDNDQSIDCSHAAFFFGVDVRCLPLQSD